MCVEPETPGFIRKRLRGERWLVSKPTNPSKRVYMSSVGSREGESKKIVGSRRLSAHFMSMSGNDSLSETARA